jgi:hypothetical protein
MNYYSNPTHDKSDPASRLSPWHRFRPAFADGRTPLLFWLTVLVLGGCTLTAVAWGASRVLARTGSEKLLRVELLFPKLKNNPGERKATAFRMSEPEISELAHPKDWKTPQPFVPAAASDQPKVTNIETPPLPVPALPEPPRVEIQNLAPPPALPPEPVCDDPVIYLKPCTPERGDSPMKRNWKSVAMYLAVSAAAVMLEPPPILAQGKGNKDPDFSKLERSLLDKLKTELKKLENGPLKDLSKNVQGIGDDVKTMSATVNALNTAVSALQANQLQQKLALDSQKKEIDALTDEVRGLRTRLSQGAAPASDKLAMDEMIKTMKAIQEGIARLGPADKRVSLSPPTNGATVTSGRVVIQNLYSEDLLFIINGAAFRVLPGTSRVIENVPLGPVQYRVHSARWGTLENRTTTLTAAEHTFNLTAANR